MTAKYFTEITKGMEYADANWPGWKERINLDTFNMRWYESCIVGQMTGDYDAWAYENPFREFECGFAIDGNKAPLEGRSDFYREEYARLTAEWKAAITGHPSFAPAV